MMLVVTVLFGVVLVKLLVVAGVAPQRSVRSSFEREHSRSKSAATVLDEQREKYFSDVLAVQQAVVSLLIALIAILAVAGFGWLVGVGVTVVIALLYGSLARTSFLQKQSQRLYERIEVPFLQWISAHDKLLGLIRRRAINLSPVTAISSRKELEHIIKEMSKEVITPDERSQLLHGMAYSEQYVRDYVLPRDKVPSIDKAELLGPLVLDDLHKTNYSRFAVIDGDIDNVIGVLDIQTMLRLDVKRSMTAEKAMDPRVLYIHEGQSLEQALAVCLNSHQSMLVAVDDRGMTRGVILLDDIIRSLVGRDVRYSGEYHENPQAAARAAVSSAAPAKKSDAR